MSVEITIINRQTFAATTAVKGLSEYMRLVATNVA